MSADRGELGAFSDPERDSSQIFMLTFAAIGGLALLDAEPAAASLSTPAAPIPEDAHLLLSGAAPTSLGPSQTSSGAGDAMFLSAIAAFAPSFSEAPAYAIVAQIGAANDLSAADAAPPASDARNGDDPVGSSTPIDALVADLRTFSVRGDNLVVALAAGSTLTLGGQDDLVLTSAGDVVTVLSESSVAMRGAGAEVFLASDDRLSLSGVGYRVVAAGAGDVVTVQANSQATLIGQGLEADVAAPSAAVTLGGESASANSVYMPLGGALSLMDSATVAAHGLGAAYLGANDFLKLFGAFDVYAPQAAGASTVSFFGADDILHLHSAFSDIASLLGASTQFDGATTLNLGASGDSVTLAGLDKAQVAAFAGAGEIRLD